MHYYLNTVNPQTNRDSEFAFSARWKRWHERLEQAHTDAIQNKCCHRVMEGLQISSDNVSEKCVSYSLAKSSLVSIPKNNETRSSHVLSMIHSDVSMQSELFMGVSKCFNFIIDDYSRNC